MPKVLYIAQHFWALLIVMSACIGLGRPVVRQLIDRRLMDRGLTAALSMLTGLGIAIVTLLVLALAGQLRPFWINGLLGLGCLSAAWGAWRHGRARNADGLAARPALSVPHWTTLAVATVLLCTALAPLCPPFMWDELAYHLPHAQQWARTGSLTVTPWLRYPWFPFNFNLLYAASLVVYDDVFTHLLNALAGWLVAVMLWRFGVQQGARIAGALAAVLWLFYSRDGYVNAYVDFGTAAFVLGGLLLLARAHATGYADRSVVLSGFLLGVAAGIKYQALVFAPPLMCMLLMQKASRRHLVWATAAFALPCLYWYGRNAWVTGDPFDPLGGKLFGFYDWNLADYDYQLLDLRNGRGWPPAWLWPALVAPLLLLVRSTPPPIKTLTLIAGYSAVVWLVTSRLPRYLTPTAPLLCLLSAWICTEPIRLLAPRAQRLAARWPAVQQPDAWRWLNPVAMVLVVAVMWRPIGHNLQRDMRQIAATPLERQAFLQRALPEYQGILKFLNGHSGLHVYQNGMESVLYYASQPIYGDHFGPWRYHDFMVTPPSKIAQKFRAAGLDTFAVRVPPTQEPLDVPGFAEHFQEVYRDPMFRVYALKR